jgi:NAD+ kinase
MQVAIHARSFHKDNFVYVKAIWDLLLGSGYKISISYSFRQFLSKNKISGLTYHSVFNNYQEFKDNAFAISLGGDGTLLETITYIGRSETPVIGVNMGRLGFLAYTRREESIAAIESVIQGKHKITKRSLIEFKDEDHTLFEGVNYALNECAIMKRDSSSMIVIHTYLNDRLFNSYWADGLVFSTPTGSTGYSLSCGGPLVMPDTKNFIVAPISPHNLNVRPILVPDDAELSFEIEGRAKNFLLSLDSRSKLVKPHRRFFIKKADFSVLFIETPEYNFFKNLRDKLNWGLDSRN